MSIPYNNYVKNNIAHFEGYYASVIYAYLTSLGLHIVAEDVNNKGRIDLTIIVDDYIYIMEFKVIKTKEKEKNQALEQLKEKDYQKKYLSYNKPITLVGILFGEEERNVVALDYE